MTMFRELARKLAAFLVGLVAAYIGNLLLGVGVSPDDVAATITALEVLTTVLITVVFFFLGDGLLAKVKALFPAAWAEQFWKEQAAEKVQPLAKTDAKAMIRGGKV